MFDIPPFLEVRVGIAVASLMGFFVVFSERSACNVSVLTCVCLLSVIDRLFQNVLD